MSYRLVLVVPGLPRLNTSATRRHWATQSREAKRWREVVVLLVGRRRPPKPLARAHLRVTRHSARPADRDNIAASMKACRDGLVEAGVLLDDSIAVLASETYEWSAAPRGHGRVEMEVREA